MGNFIQNFSSQLGKNRKKFPAPTGEGKYKNLGFFPTFLLLKNLLFRQEQQIQRLGQLQKKIRNKLIQGKGWEKPQNSVVFFFFGKSSPNKSWFIGEKWKEFPDFGALLLQFLGFGRVFFPRKKWEKHLGKAIGAAGRKQLQREGKILQNPPKILDFAQVLGFIPKKSEVFFHPLEKQSLGINPEEFQSLIPEKRVLESRNLGIKIGGKKKGI